MKKLFFMIAALAMSIAASAQTTRVIKGAVIDRKTGNPLPGATVSATGGSEITTVDADGTFALEVPVWLKSATAQYAGMANKKMKVSAGNMIFRMKPKVNQWFVVADYAHCFGDEGDGNMGGLMAGRLGKWGWYGKFHVGVSDWDGEILWNVTAGVTKRIINPLHVYVGFGTGFVPEYRYSWYWRSVDTEWALVPEIGLIGKIAKHFLIHAGYQPMIDFDGRVGHTINAGLGYAF